MARYYGYDVIKAINTQLVNNLPSAITTINTTRSTSVTPIKQFTYSYIKNMFPICYTMLDESTVDFEAGELNDDIDREIETYSGSTTIMNKTATNKEDFSLDMEIYGEAVQKTLHGFDTPTGITWTFCTTVSRDIYNENNMNYKSVTINWIVRVN